MDANATDNDFLAEMINAKMRRAVMPVTVFVGVEVVLVFFGNLVVFYVFLFRYHSCNFRYFVLCLALTDIMSTVTTMPGEIVTQLYWYVYPVPMVCKIKSFFNVFTVSAEAICLFTIAVDRYRKVCHPHGWEIKPRMAKLLCIIIFIAAFALSFPVAFYWGTHEGEEQFNGTDVKTTVCEKDQKYLDSNKPLDYSASIDAIISILLAFMLLLYILIARQLLCGRLGKNASSGSTKTYDKKVRRTGTSIAEVMVKVKNEPSETSSDCVKEDDGKTGDADAAKGNVASDPDSLTEYTSSSIKRAGGSSRTGTIHKDTMNAKIKRNTLIMFILTVTFVITTIMYLTLLSFIADGILRSLTDGQRAAYFFFFRFYFINHVINPFVYGLLDPKFRSAIIQCKRAAMSSVTST